MIPRRIWQTYKTKKLPRISQPCVQTWKRQNPAFEHQLFDDGDIEAFVGSHLGGDALSIFQSLPLPVMKADFWRYAVLHKWGGVYADIDTMCKIPVRDWDTRGKGLIVGVENSTGIHFCQWTIMAKPEHPVLTRVIGLVLERASRGVDTNYQHFVHYHTGPGVWTDALRLYLDIAETEPPSDAYGYPNDDARDINAEAIYRNRELWLPHDISLVGFEAFNHQWVAHLAASSRWADDSQYVSWIQHRLHV